MTPDKVAGLKWILNSKCMSFRDVKHNVMSNCQLSLLSLNEKNTKKVATVGFSVKVNWLIYRIGFSNQNYNDSFWFWSSIEKS